MWARRIGVPATWPSRVKVFLYSLATGAIGWTIYSFMVSSNVGYLDLSRPSTEPVLCVAAWPESGGTQNWWNEDSWGDWLHYHQDRTGFLEQHTCVVPSVDNATCDTVSVPLHLVNHKLGVPLRLGSQGFDWKQSVSSREALSIYSHLFLVLSICLWLAISCHDHALLHTVNKNYILDLQGVSREFPRVEKLCGYVMGTSTIRSLLKIKGSCSRRCLGLLMAVVIGPLLIAWRFFLFMFVICPMMGFFFFLYPIRTSRLWIFAICVVSMVYGLCLTIHMLFFFSSDSLRPRYAVTWLASSTHVPGRVAGVPGNCFCGCAFPLSEVTMFRLLGIGVLAAIKSFVLAFRCLKGLRRSSWANLMSVTFTVPVNAYSVEWTRPDGRPIKNRFEGQSVQSELAFDPFALMDEQPESANSHVTLKPTSVMSWEFDEDSGQRKLRQTSSRHLLGPAPPMLSEDIEAAFDSQSMKVLPMEYIGCCGFPRRTGGLKGFFNMNVSEPVARPKADSFTALSVIPRMPKNRSDKAARFDDSNESQSSYSNWSQNPDVDLNGIILQTDDREVQNSVAPNHSYPSDLATEGMVRESSETDFVDGHGGFSTTKDDGWGLEARLSRRLPQAFFPMVSGRKLKEERRCLAESEVREENIEPTGEQPPTHIPSDSPQCCALNP